MINEFFTELELYIPKTAQVKYSLDIKIDIIVFIIADEIFTYHLYRKEC